MAHRFGIIGGGWYGCHIATSLRSLGFDVRVFDGASRLLDSASGNNQFRLHLGFHYARHYGTRMQSRDGFSRFVERYPGLSRAVEDNIYAVSRGDSLIDFLTYKLIMTSSGIEFSEMAAPPPELVNVEGCLRTPERVLLLAKARSYFRERLDGVLELGHTVGRIEPRGEQVYVDGSSFDFVIDATWGHLTRPPIDLFYEPTLLLYYEANGPFPAVTLVDGPLCSVYPTEDPSLYTLSSVTHTPLGRYATSTEARAALAAVTPELVAEKVARMEAEILRYVPTFRDVFRFLGPQLAIKTKPIGSFDDRSCHVFRDGRIFSVMSGKIDTVFFAVERILTMLEAMPDSDQHQDGGRLKAEVAAAFPRPGGGLAA